MRIFINSLTGITPAIVPINYITPLEFASRLASTPDSGTLDLGGDFVLSTPESMDINQNITIINGGFKRADTKRATVTVEATAGSTEITVDDASQFNAGEWTMIAFGIAVDETCDINERRILSITGNVITLDGQGILRTAPVGSILAHRYKLLDFDELNNITFNNITFDGNKANNNVNYDWKVNKIAHLYGSKTIVKNCIIKDSPNESFTCWQGTIFEDNEFYNLNGSIIHFSNPLDAVVETIIRRNIGDGVCLVPEAINGHNEGCWTNSNKSQFIRIEDNNVKNGGNAVYGSFGVDDYNFNVSGNVYENFLRKVWADSANELDYSLDTFINVPD